MKFDFLAHREEPAFEVFRHAVESVFEGSACTQENLVRLSNEARLVYLLWYFDGEMQKGGLSNFFIGPAGGFCQEILEHLTAVGADSCHQVLSRGIALFPDGRVPEDRDTRIQTWEPIYDSDTTKEALTELDNRFYAYEDNLAGLLDDYVCSHKEAMVATQTSTT